MCQHKSGIVVRVDETTCKIFCLPREDSHSKIREHFNLSDDSLLGRFQTPVEFVPVRGLDKIEDYDFKFDDNKPDWWRDEFEAEAKRVLFAQSQLDIADVFPGKLDLKSLTTLPAGCKLEAGFTLYLNSLTTLPAGCKLSAGSDLDLGSLRSLSAGCKLSAGVLLDLGSLTSLPADCKISTGGYLDLGSVPKDQLAAWKKAQGKKAQGK